MNTPDKERLEHIEAEQKETNRRLDELERKQQTEPIKVVLEQRQTEAEQTLLQKIMEMVGTQAPDIGKLKGDVQEVKAIVANIKATVSDHSEMLKSMATKNDISRLETTMATKDDIANLKATQDQILTLLQQKPGP